MSKFPQTADRTDRHPSWFQAAKTFYGAAFEPKKKTDLAEAMADWCEMDADERGFVLAHLQYLNLLAARGTQRLLRELRALVAELGDEVVEGLDGLGDLVEPGDEVVVEEDEAAEVPEGEGEGPDEKPTAGRRLELVEDTPIPGYEPDPRPMPIEAVAPEMLRGAEKEPVELFVVEDEDDDDAPEGA